MSPSKPKQTKSKPGARAAAPADSDRVKADADHDSEGEEENEVDVAPGPVDLPAEEADSDEPVVASVVGEPRPGRGLATRRDPVALFLTEARRYPRLSEEEERELGKAVRERGDMDAARKLVVHNLRLVVSIAYQYRRAWTNILDLFQEGSVGLMDAVKRWEPTLGPRFGSYAAYWIRAYVLRFLLTNSRLIHVGNTRAGRKLFFRLERERQKLLAAGIEVTPKLLAAKLDVAEKDLDEVRQHLESREVSLEPRPGADGEGTYSLADRIAIDARSPEDQAAQAEMSGALKQFVEQFQGALTDERESVVWREHLSADEPVPLGELGARFGVSKQRMGQIADRLKKRFREEIATQLGTEIKADWLGE